MGRGDLRIRTPRSKPCCLSPIALAVVPISGQFESTRLSQITTVENGLKNFGFFVAHETRRLSYALPQSVYGTR